MSSTVGSVVASTFTYPRRLDSANREIRLLSVKAGQLADPVHCDLRYAIVGQEQTAVYETISYTWGDSRERDKIYIRASQLDVPASSANVLRRMRRPDSERFLRIDAICINQEDVVERNEQVAMMASIYANTYRNLIWLGDYDYLPELAVEAVEVVLNEARQTTDNLVNFADTVLTANGDAWLLAAEDRSVNMRTDYWEALARLFSSPWFQRVWVFQEAALSPSNICHYGEVEIALDDITKCAVWLWHCNNFLPAYWVPKIAESNLLLLWQYTNTALTTGTGDKSIRLMDLLEGFRELKAYDQRDHVYGLLGLWSKFQQKPELPDILKPDYEKDFRDIFLRTTRYGIREKMDLDHFDGIRQWPPSDRCDGHPTPSWVPQWHMPVVPELGNFSRAFRSCGAKDKYHELATICEDPSILVVRGVVVDTVTSILSADRRGVRGKRHFEMVQTIDQALKGAGQDEPQRTKTIARTLCAESDHRGRPIDSETAIARFEVWKTFLSTCDDRAAPIDLTISDVTREGTMRTVYEYDVAFAAASSSRSVFLSRKGRLGLGPQDTREGDFVAILWGSRYPVVLRRLPQDDCFEVIGISYVHGIMHGEAVKDEAATAQAEMVFRLR